MGTESELVQFLERTLMSVSLGVILYHSWDWWQERRERKRREKRMQEAHQRFEREMAELEKKYLWRLRQPKDPFQ